MKKRIIKKQVAKKEPTKPVILSEKDEKKKDIDIASALEAVSVSQGGKIIQEGLVSDIVNLVTSLSIRYKHATQLELVCLCADLKTKIDILHVLSRAQKNKDFLLEQIGDALKE